MSKKITIIGAGGYGSSLAYILSQYHQVVLYDIDEEIISEINTLKTNKRYLGEVEFNLSIHATTDLKVAISNADYIIIATPSRFIRSVFLSMKKQELKEQIIINVSKGFEIETGKMICEIFTEIFPERKYATLSGPSHAEEIVLKMPTFLTVASEDQTIAKQIQQDLSNSTFRIYRTDDVIGVELGGCIKNIIAIGAGIISGLGYGDNTQAGLIVRSLHEMNLITDKFGAQPQTVNQLSGLGDLIVTCTSEHSRNRTFGKLVSQKTESIEQILSKVGTVEGYYALQSLNQRLNGQLERYPIINAIYQVVFNDRCPEETLETLMDRPLKSELV